MNFLVVFFAILGCTYGQYRALPVAPRSGQNVAILKQSSDVNPDGSYSWSYEADNGIAAQEQGHLKNVPNSPEPGTEAQGSFHYTAPDGTPIALQYVANEDGFQPQGAHLPVAPPVPEPIARALAWIAAHPEPQSGANPGRRFK